MAACSAVHDDDCGATGGGGGGGAATGGKVQCPMAACSGVQLEGAAAGGGGGGTAGGKVQCPMAACSGVQAVGEVAAGAAGWAWPLCWARAGAVPASSRIKSAFMPHPHPTAGP